MTRWATDHGFSYEEIKEMQEECRADFRVGNIDEKAFRRRMVNLGIMGVELDTEVKENEPY